MCSASERPPRRPGPRGSACAQQRALRTRAGARPWGRPWENRARGRAGREDVGADPGAKATPSVTGQLNKPIATPYFLAISWFNGICVEVDY